MDMARWVRTLAGRTGTLVRVETDRPLVALTFDDGPDPTYTPVVLDLLARSDAKATFFLDGPSAQRSPDLVARIRRDGHCVGLHGWSHVSAVQSPGAGGLRAQMSEIRRARHAVGKPTTLYRPPYGHESRWTRLAAALTGHQVVYWKVAVRDWEVTSPAEMADRIRVASRPGNIVLLHDGLRTAADSGAFDRQFMIDALAIVLADGSAEQTYVTVPDLLAAGRPILRHRRPKVPSLLPAMTERPERTAAS